jgi:hypothetical protein
MNTDDTQRQADGPEAGATPEAIALHGDQAREERHEQPEAVTLDGDTRIATSDARSGDEADGSAL